jgi:O-antigen ligase
MNAQSLTRWSGYLLLLLFAFAMLVRGGKGIEATWLLAGIGSVVVIGSILFREKKEKDITPELWLTGMLFVAWTIVSFLLSATRNYGLDEVLRDATLILLTFWIIRHADASRTKSFMHLFLRVFIAFTLLACAVGMAVYVLQPVNRLVGTFFYVRFSRDYWPNAFAEYLLLAWPVVLWWASEVTKKRVRALRFVLLGIVLGCLLLTFSRGAFIAFVGQVFLLGFFRWRSGISMRAGSLWKSLVGIAVVSVAVFFAMNALRSPFFPVQSVEKKVTFTAEEGSTSFTERLSFFSQSLTLSQEHPWFGWGPYSFRFVQPRLQTEVLATSDHPHNVFLKLALERGWPAALLFLAFLTLILWPGLHTSVSKKTDAMDFATSYRLTIVLGVLAHNLIDYNLQFLAVSLPFFIVFGFLGKPSPRALRPFLRVSMRTLECALAIAILVVALWEGQFLVTSALGRREEARENIPGALSWYARSVDSLFPRDVQLSRARYLVKQNAFIDAENALGEYLRGNAEDARAWKLLGEIQLQMQRREEAVRSLDQAYVLGKWNDAGIAFDELKALLSANDTNRIQKLKPSVLQLITKYARALNDNTHYIALSQNLEQYMELSRVAGAVYPDDAPTIMQTAVAIRDKAVQMRGQSKVQKGYLW